MWHSSFREPLFVIKNLRSFVNRTLSDAYGASRISRLWKPSHMDVFSTNLEWMHVPSFRRPDIEAWHQKVLKSNNIFYFRWGDAPLRTVIVNHFLYNSSFQFDAFSYGHSSWEEFQGQQKTRKQENNNKRNKSEEKKKEEKKKKKEIT
jgi:hypothetical protein